jgi:hypothetical protein
VKLASSVLVSSVFASWVLAGVLAVATAALLDAAPPVIGTVVAKGSFRLDNATVNGNATLFEGAYVETSAVGSSMELANGAKITLAAASKGRFFGDHVVLEKGAGQIVKAEGLRFEARGLSIQPETGDASARIALAGATRVDVSATTGSFRVRNSRGVLVANLSTGSTIEFEPQAPNTPSKLTGCLVFRAGHYLLTDETTNVVVELAGPGLDKEKGNRVEIAGGMDPTASPVSDASQFIRVSAVKHVGKGCVTTAAAGSGGRGSGTGAGTDGKTASGGSGTAGAGKAGRTGSGGGGLSTTTIAIIGGVAAAGAVGGLIGSGALTSSSTDVSR